MSALNWGIGDVLAVTKLAYRIYNDCYLVMKEAPDEFLRLVKELASLQGVLRTLRDDFSSDKSFLDRLGQARAQMLERCLAALKETLQRLEKLVLKYEKLGGGEASFWRKFKYVSERKTIEELKAKVMAHTVNLNLCMSTINNSSLVRIEGSISKALERQEAAQEFADTGNEMTPLSRADTALSEAHESEGLGLQGLRRQFTDTTLVSDRAMSVSPESTPSTLGIDAPNVVDAVAEAMKELSKVRKREQASRPLRVVPQDPIHKPDDELRARFHQLANDELQFRRLNTKDWLRVATWWLLKARNNLQTSERPRSINTRPSISPSSGSKSPDSQAYVDLLKASWILYEIILMDDNLTHLLIDENRTMFYSLSDGICEDLGSFQPIDIPDKETLLAQNINIWELQQPKEETFEGDNLLAGLENRRWITVEQDDAGGDDERVLYRTFVNAAIGGKGYRMRSRGAPYMLLLFTKKGESEPKLTICNQRGTLALSRDFTRNDLQESSHPTSPVSGMEHLDNSEAIPLNFPRLNVAVAFTHEDDLRRFMYIPEAYFNAVRRREPRQLEKATETLLFESSVQDYEQLKVSTMKSRSPPEMGQSCDIRILETTGKEGWRTTRRLVISSSASEKRPWCTEFFLPLSRVQLNRAGMDRQVTIKWSDCSHERAEGKDVSGYHRVYTYVYDDSNPNVALTLLFLNQEDAVNFEKTVLQLSLLPIYSFSTGLDSRDVYTISDTEPNPKQYKAILLTHTRFDWKYAELFYMYRDTDYQYDHSSLRVRFPQVYYTDYISTHVEKLYKPPVNGHPHFSHCEKKVGNVPIDFDEESISQAFMSSLTLNHELIFSRRAHYITTKAPSRFGSKKSNKGNAEVQLWRKGKSMRLVSRWDDTVEDKWLTTAIPTTTGSIDPSHGKDSNRAVLPRVEYDRGSQIDMANMMARHPREKTEAKKMGPITIAFESVRDREEFAVALTGTAPPRVRSPVGDLIGF